MLKDHYVAMAKYNRWMNERVYATAGELTDAERKRDLGAFFKSIHGTLNHLLLADCAWMKRFARGDDTFLLRDANGVVIELRALHQVLYDDFDELRAARADYDNKLIEWASGLDDAYLHESFAYRTSAGGEYEHVRWWAISHLFNHQTHHRGQVTDLLNQLGKDVGVTDLAAMLRT